VSFWGTQDIGNASIRNFYVLGDRRSTFEAQISPRNLRCRLRPSTQDENTSHFRTQPIYLDAQTQLQEGEGLNHQSSKSVRDMTGIVAVWPNIHHNFQSRS
jgi:hypothetical protein